MSHQLVISSSTFIHTFTKLLYSSFHNDYLNYFCAYQCACSSSHIAVVCVHVSLKQWNIFCWRSRLQRCGNVDEKIRQRLVFLHPSYKVYSNQSGKKWFCIFLLPAQKNYKLSLVMLTSLNKLEKILPAVSLYNCPALYTCSPKEIEIYISASLVSLMETMALFFCNEFTPFCTLILSSLFRQSVA